MRQVLVQCEDLRAATGGAFDAFAVPAPNGTTLDPSGFVKGWAIERAAGLLEDRGLHDFCINGGGDVVVRGNPSSGPTWRVGIRDPSDSLGLLEIVRVTGPTAIATSGTYERGAHIVDPTSGEPSAHLAGVTVIGADLGLADAYATAVFVMGLGGLDWLSEQGGYEGLCVDHDGTWLGTQGVAALLERAPASGIA